MKALHRLLLTLSLSEVTATAATLITEPTRTYTVGFDIPDLQDPPLSFLQTINDSTIFSLTDVLVGLHLVDTTVGNGFAGEMFVSLNKDLSLTSILLNRVGVTSLDPVGHPYDGWDVGFQDSAPNGDVHSVAMAALSSGVLSGLYQPDGRTSPTDVARPAMLASFITSTGNGDWRLSVADLQFGGSMRLQSWSLTLSGMSNVPEPLSFTAGLALLGVLGTTWWGRRHAR